jgi:hypothetical protein
MYPQKKLVSGGLACLPPCLHRFARWFGGVWVCLSPPLPSLCDRVFLPSLSLLLPSTFSFIALRCGRRCGAARRCFLCGDAVRDSLCLDALCSPPPSVSSWFRSFLLRDCSALSAVPHGLLCPAPSLSPSPRFASGAGRGDGAMANALHIGSG